MRRNQLWSLVLGVGIALLVQAACGGNGEEAVPAGEPEAAGEEEMAEGEEMMEEHTQSHVIVEDQDASSGSVVIADIFSLEGSAWMVIHADADGKPGPVLGFAPVTEGQNHDVGVEIDLSQATPILYAMLHTDAGAVGEYEFPGPDGPVQDAEGKVITPPFNVSLPDSVAVSDQPVAKGTVTIDRVVYSGAGWIVIHADNGEGKPGPILGKAPVSAGVNTNVVVEIDEAGATDTLFAMLHTDAGTEGEFEFPKGEDGPVMDAEGNVIMPPFNTAVDASVAVEDQVISEDGTVTITEAVMLVDGWMVIHADNGEGKPGPVVGFAPLAAGINRNVAVGIDEAGATDTLFAMPHVDAGTAGDYEFPGDDAPVKDAGGNILVKPFSAQGGEAMAGGESAVSIIDSGFGPEEIVVSAGTTVVWTQKGSLPHTVTSDDDLFDSDSLSKGDTFSFTFEEPGTYPYYCKFHGGPGGTGMAGTVTVTG